MRQYEFDNVIENTVINTGLRMVLVRHGPPRRIVEVASGSQVIMSDGRHADRLFFVKHFPHCFNLSHVDLRPDETGMMPKQGRLKIIQSR